MAAGECVRSFLEMNPYWLRIQGVLKSRITRSPDSNSGAIQPGVIGRRASQPKAILRAAASESTVMAGRKFFVSSSIRPAAPPGERRAASAGGMMVPTIGNCRRSSSDSAPLPASGCSRRQQQATACSGRSSKVPVLAQGKHRAQEADIDRHAPRLSRQFLKCIGRMSRMLFYFDRLKTAQLRRAARNRRVFPLKMHTGSKRFLCFIPNWRWGC